MDRVLRKLNNYSVCIVAACSTGRFLQRSSGVPPIPSALHRAVLPHLPGSSPGPNRLSSPDSSPSLFFSLPLLSSYAVLVIPLHAKFFSFQHPNLHGLSPSSALLAVLAVRRIRCFPGQILPSNLTNTVSYILLVQHFLINPLFPRHGVPSFVRVV